MSTPLGVAKSWPTIRWFGAIAVGVSLALLITGCGAPESWFIPRSPTIFVAASGPCPGTVGKARDVRATAQPGQPLIPSRADANLGLICIYGGAFNPITRVRQIALDAAAASHLAAVLSRVSLGGPPAGPVNCPEDTGQFALISLRLAGHRDANVWWDMTGCQTLDNGVVGATEGANKSFFAFQNAIAGMIR